MTKRFWKWNAILSSLAYFWMLFSTTIVLHDGKEPKFIAGFLAIQLMMTVWSLLTVIKNKKKPNNAIVGLNYDVNKIDPQKLLWHIMQERACTAFSYSLAIGLPFRYLSVLNDHLQLWLMLGTFLLGAAYILYALFDYAKKSGELEV